MCTSIETLGHLVEVAREWDKKFFDPGKGFPLIWWRGHADVEWDLLPTVLRPWFIQQVNSGELLSPEHVRLLQRERTINRQFRRRAASYISGRMDNIDLYVLSQHHGMPTRILDWTDTYLPALFFACASHHDRDGAVFVMNPRFLLPRDEDPANPVYPSDVVHIRHDVVAGTVATLYGEGDRLPNPCIVPFLPDLEAGRLHRQASCFTLHMPPFIDPANAGNTPQEPHLQITCAEKWSVPKEAKPELLIDLRRAGISWETLFADLDNVSKEIRTACGMHP